MPHKDPGVRKKYAARYRASHRDEASLYSAIRNTMYYWGHRIILGLDATDSYGMPGIMHAHYTNVWRRKRANERDLRRHEETYGRR